MNTIVMSVEIKTKAECGRLGGLAARGTPKRMSKRAKRAKALKAWATRRSCQRATNRVKSNNALDCDQTKQ